MHWGQWCLKKANQQDKHLDHYWGQCCSKTVSDLMNFSSNWWATLHLKDIFISSSWFIISNMAIDRCGHTVAFERIWKRCAHHQDWRWTKDVPEGHFHSIIFWNMASNWWGYMNKCNWMVKGCTHQDWLWDHLVLKLEGALHRMNMGDKMNIIDDATAFLFTIWFDKLREIHEKEHWAYNDESFTASYEMHVWTIG